MKRTQLILPITFTQPHHLEQGEAWDTYMNRILEFESKLEEYENAPVSDTLIEQVKLHLFSLIASCEELPFYSGLDLIPKVEAEEEGLYIALSTNIPEDLFSQAIDFLKEETPALAQKYNVNILDIKSDTINVHADRLYSFPLVWPFTPTFWTEQLEYNLQRITNG